MLDNIRSWYLRNQIQITWFLIGWLCLGGLSDFFRENYTGALVLWAIALLNYVTVKK